MPPVGERDTVANALPGYIEQIVAKTELAESTVRRWLRKMRAAEPKQVHVVSWRRNTGAPSPRFMAGPGEDAPRPKAKTNAEYSMKWRKDRRKERRKEQIERSEALAATLAQVDHAARTPQTWASALMGL